MKQRKRAVVTGRQVRRIRPLVLVLSIVLTVFIVLGSSLAWFTAGDSKVNKVKTPQNKTFLIELVDEFEPPVCPPVPNDKIAKTVGAINKDEKPGFVRILVLPVFLLDNGTVLPAEFGVHLDANWNFTDWMDGGDGYYYYLHRLEAGESTDTMSPKQNLFTEITLLPDAHTGARLRIEVKCEAVGTKQWEYRSTWWGTTSAPASIPYAAIDATLAPLTTS